MLENTNFRISDLSDKNKDERHFEFKTSFLKIVLKESGLKNKNSKKEILIEGIDELEKEVKIGLVAESDDTLKTNEDLNDILMLKKTLDNIIEKNVTKEEEKEFANKKVKKTLTNINNLEILVINDDGFDRYKFNEIDLKNDSLTNTFSIQKNPFKDIGDLNDFAKFNLKGKDFFLKTGEVELSEENNEIFNSSVRSFFKTEEPAELFSIYDKEHLFRYFALRELKLTNHSLKDEFPNNFISNYIKEERAKLLKEEAKKLAIDGVIKTLNEDFNGKNLYKKELIYFDFTRKRKIFDKREQEKTRLKRLDDFRPFITFGESELIVHTYKDNSWSETNVFIDLEKNVYKKEELDTLLKKARKIEKDNLELLEQERKAYEDTINAEDSYIGSSKI